MRQGGFNDPEWRIDVCFHRQIKLLSANIQNGLMRLLPACIVEFDEIGRLSATSNALGSSTDWLKRP